MKTKEKLGRFNFKLSLLILLAFVGVVTWSCSDDEEVAGPTGPDTRLEGRDLVIVAHVNPLTGDAYTVEELAATAYDPTKEEHYSSNQRIELFFWAQQKPEKIEVINDANGDVIAQYTNFNRDDRPELSTYKAGYGYSARYRVKIGLATKVWTISCEI